MKNCKLFGNVLSFVVRFTSLVCFAEKWSNEFHLTVYIIEYFTAPSERKQFALFPIILRIYTTINIESPFLNVNITLYSVYVIDITLYSVYVIDITLYSVYVIDITLYSVYVIDITLYSVYVIDITLYSVYVIDITLYSVYVIDILHESI